VIRFGAAGYIVQYTIVSDGSDILVLRIWTAAKREHKSEDARARMPIFAVRRQMNAEKCKLSPLFLALLMSNQTDEARRQSTS
jgi:hypothetical protein